MKYDGCPGSSGGPGGPGGPAPDGPGGPSTSGSCGGLAYPGGPDHPGGPILRFTSAQNPFPYSSILVQHDFVFPISEFFRTFIRNLP